jgi:hypothetical protein
MKWKSLIYYCGFSFLILLFLYAVGMSAPEDPLYEALLKTAPQNLPEGFSAPTISEGVVQDAEKSAGVLGFVQLVFAKDSKARINYVFFPSAEQAKQYSQFLAQQIAFSPGERKTLPNLPNADCIDREPEAQCNIPQDQIVIIALASKVDDGAAPLIQMAVDHLRAVKGTIQSEYTASSKTESTADNSLDPCSLVTQSDAETTLGQPVREARRDSANACFYGSQSNPGDSVMIQLIDGGTGKYEFDRSRVSKPVSVTGIGDQAFAFVSPGGFVQLCMVKGNQYVALMVNKRRDSNLLDATKGLANRVAERLPSAPVTTLE